MAMALTASPQSALPSGPSWDESIVPSLRKRLETESRILTKRLSTISITDDGYSKRSDHTKSPSHDSPDSYLQRPSAIPRPSFSSRPPTSAATESTRKSAPTKRQRTQSTPFPFDPSDSSIPNGYPNDATSPVPSSSGSTSPRLQSPRVTGSRIPTASARGRSGSQSSQSISQKVGLPLNHKFTASETTVSPTQSLRGKASSSSLARHRIIDERPPFTNDPSPNVLEREFTDRPSAEEERTFQHWYRGDMSRSGGVGEYRVGKRMEMLDIANYGHLLRGKQIRAYEEPIPRSPGIDINVAPRKRAESVSSMERTSIYIDDDGVASRVLDETPLTDIEADETDYGHSSHSYISELPAEFGMRQYSQRPQLQQRVNGVARTLPTNHNRGLETESPPASLPTRLPFLKPQTSNSRIPQAQVRPQKRKESTSSVASASAMPLSEPPTPVKSNQSRGRAQANTGTRVKAAAKAKPQKRSKSAGDALHSNADKRESRDYGGLADAVPETSSPIPPDGNWDEVILPTVARRMGIEYEKEDPRAAARRKERELRIEPAPGTFGFDHTKYRAPRGDEVIHMNEFGMQQSDASPPVADQDEAANMPAPSISLRFKRDTMPSTAPFSQYLSSDTMPEPVPDPGRRAREWQDIPSHTVGPPANTNLSQRVEESEGAGCCKCVVM